MPKRAVASGSGKHSPLNMRTTKDLREKLEKAAGRSGRSLTQEVEARLEQSLSGDFLLAQLMGSGKNASLLKFIAMKLSGLDQQAYPWHSHPDSAQRLLEQIKQTMQVVAKTESQEEATGVLHSLSLSELSSKAGVIAPSVLIGSRADVKKQGSKKR